MHAVLAQEASAYVFCSYNKPCVLDYQPVLRLATAVSSFCTRTPSTIAAPVCQRHKLEHLRCPQREESPVKIHALGVIVAWFLAIGWLEYFSVAPAAGAIVHVAYYRIARHRDRDSVHSRRDLLGTVTDRP